MAIVEKAVLNGAELIKALAATGTGDDKLELPRQMLAFIKRKENRILSATEVIDILEKAGVTDNFAAWPRTPALTLEKARSLAATGKWELAEKEEIPVEELILSGAELPPEAEPTSEEKFAEEFNSQTDFKEEMALGLKPAEKLGKKTVPKKPAKSETQKATAVAQAPAQTAAA